MQACIPHLNVYWYNVKVRVNLDLHDNLRNFVSETTSQCVPYFSFLRGRTSLRLAEEAPEEPSKGGDFYRA